MLANNFPSIWWSAIRGKWSWKYAKTQNCVDSRLYYGQNKEPFQHSFVIQMQFPYGISFDRKISGKVSRMYTDEQYIRVKEIVSKGNKDSINGTYPPH